MALGFGFNKTKVLASAEKYVQQGKLQNAISEYEKVVKEDPKDLTVLNTIGDLYARIGQNDQAANCFRKVGEAYAAEGFTVKAIAMYKKLTKLNPSATEAVQKLAELYTQQGLYNDARQQYVVMADIAMKNGDFENAARTFQKILELDPENEKMRGKLAELYIKMGRKAEARDIFLNAAQNLAGMGSFEAADEALGKVLAIEPDNADALCLRGQIAADSGDGGTAIQYLERIPNLDSRLDALRPLLRAQILMAQLDQAEATATKLLNVHNDISGVTTLAQSLFNAGMMEHALRVFDAHGDRLLMMNQTGVLDALHATLGRIKDHVPSLETVRKLYQKAGDNSHMAEVTELLAHASAHSGDYARARDLYQQLMTMEPENPIHQENYKQMVAKLGDESTAKPLSPEQAASPFMGDVMAAESAPPVIKQKYSDTVQQAIDTALSTSQANEADIAAAIAPIEAVLPQAADDIQLNIRLADLYSKANRLEEAALCCDNLTKVYQAAGDPSQANAWMASAGQYRERSFSDFSSVPAPEVPVVVAAQQTYQQSGALAELVVERGGAAPAAISAPAISAPVAAEAPVPMAPAMEAAFEIPVEPVAPMAPEMPVAAAPVAEFAPAPEIQPGGAVAEFSFESTGAPPVAEVPVAPVVAEFAMDAPAAAAAAEAPAPAAREVELNEWESITSVEAPPAAPAPDLFAEAAQETRFYISQSMWTEAAAALAKAEGINPQAPELAGLRIELSSARAAAPPPPAPVAEVAPALAPEPVAEVMPAPVEAGASVAEFVFEAEAPTPVAPVVEPNPAPAPAPEPVAAPAPVVEAPPPPPPPAPKPEPKAAPAPPPPAPAPAPAPVAASEDLLGDLVDDLEESLGEDFAIGGKPAAAPSPAPAPKIAPPPPAPAAAPAVMASAAAPAPAPAAPEVPLGKESSSILEDIFDDFKEDVEETAGEAEDPDTHYNLGVAFKEMGLLDEAIGELQKVCQAIEHGHPFGQVMQAYTWLAHCFVEKGVPEAAVKWYQQALKVENISEDSRLAVHYELASAFEMAGNRESALKHFMEVYGSNIDYRDVAERIKGLKS